jgi:hypothetical protein
MKSHLDTPDERPAILIVGDPGMRKTSLALHAPSPYIFDIDNNLAAPARFLKPVYFYDKADIDDDGKPVPLPDRYKRMVSCLNAASASPDIRTIILDSFTTLTDILIAEIRRQVPKLANPQEPLRIQDWGTFAFLFKHIITSLKSSNKIIICIAHQKIEKDESDGRYKTFLNIPGNNANYISGLFTDVLNPYPAITGINSQQKHDWKVRCLPASDNDHRGIKSSFGFSVVEPYETVAKHLASLK